MSLLTLSLPAHPRTSVSPNPFLSDQLFQKMSTFSLTTIILPPIQLVILASLSTPLILGLQLLSTSHRLLSLRLQKRADAFKPPHPHPFQFASTPGLRTRHHKARPGGHQSHDIRPEQPTVWSLGVHAGVGGYTDIAVHHYHSSGNNPLQHHHYRICKHRDPGLLLVHKANASTVHHYFALVEHEEKLLFGKEIKTARQELHHCYGLKMVYLSILFVPCGIQRQARGSRRASCYQMRQGETEVQEFRIPIRKTTSV
jgi:hypothetical protein